MLYGADYSVLLSLFLRLLAESVGGLTCFPGMRAAGDRLFRDPALMGFCVCCCGCGHVGNALALSTCPQPFSRRAHRSLNNKAKLTMTKSYGFRTSHVTEIA